MMPAVKIMLIMLCLLSPLFGELKTGDVFPKLTLMDQFGEKVKLPPRGRVQIIISFEKDISAKTKTFLETKPQNFLHTHHLVYISDVSSVPGLILNWIVLPKIQKYSFQMLLIHDVSHAALFRKSAHKLTFVTVKNNIITDIRFIEPKALKKVFP